MARIRRPRKPAHARKSNSKPTNRYLQGVSQPENARLRFPHLCHICYLLTSRVSKIQPTIPAAYKKGLRFQKTFGRSKKKQCSFCTLLFQSLSASKVEVEFGKPIHFILAAPGPEGDDYIESHDICDMNLYWEGAVEQGHSCSETLNLGRFMVSAKRGSPAAQHISNRPPILDVASQESNIQTIQWLQNCHSHHEHCTPSKTSFAPTRVVDVGGVDNIPKLLELDSHSDQYAALSYCWGMDQKVKTKTNNLKDFCKQLPVTELQQTLKDAISTTRALGLQYLWIDSLCIIQDSKDDMFKELSKMHDVYANAYVTIVAASANNCNEGFLQRRCQSPDDPVTVNSEAFSLPYLLPDNTVGKVMFQPYQSFRPSLEPINDRGWTLQENLLSPRLLIYGMQLVRQCYGSSPSAFGIQRISVTPRLGAANGLQVSGLGRTPRKPPASKIGNVSLSDFVNESRLQELQWYWSNIINDYSSRKLSNIEDKLIAISGIARQLSTTAFKDHSYKAGLWYPNSNNKSSFIYDLCWTVYQPSASQKHPYLAPSWSWASHHSNHGTGVNMKGWDFGTVFIGTRQLCEVSKFEVTAERGDPFSHITSGSLTLKGVVKEVKISKVEGSESNFEIAIPGKIVMPSARDRLLSFAEAFPSEMVNLSNADTTQSTLDYTTSFSAYFDEITPELEKDPDSVSVLCLRLLRNSGLLLTPISNEKFRRVGSFHCDGFVGPDGEESRVDGCFDGFTATQVTII